MTCFILVNVGGLGRVRINVAQILFYNLRQDGVAGSDIQLQGHPLLLPCKETPEQLDMMIDTALEALRDPDSV